MIDPLFILVIRQLVNFFGNLNGTIDALASMIFAVDSPRHWFLARIIEELDTLLDSFHEL